MEITLIFPLEIIREAKPPSFLKRLELKLKNKVEEDKDSPQSTNDDGSGDEGVIVDHRFPLPDDNSLNNFELLRHSRYAKSINPDVRRQVRAPQRSMIM